MTASAPLEFDGPPTAYCFGRTYDALSSAGLKREGHPFAREGEATEEAAWKLYEAELAAYKVGAQQIAWRIRPRVHPTERGIYIYSRLAAFP